jgi:hypothetical protein
MTLDSGNMSFGGVTGSNTEAARERSSSVAVRSCYLLVLTNYYCLGIGVLIMTHENNNVMNENESESEEEC